MENIMVLDHKAKARLGMICFLPLFCFLICFVYYLILIAPATTGALDPGAISGITRQHYDVLFVMFATSAIITTPVFIYCLVLLTKLKHMHAANKLKWIIFLSVFAPIASVFFWVFLIKDSPKYLPLYPDMG